MFLTLLLSLVSPAHALDPWWWGVGPTLGTMAIPTKYPVSLPTVAQSDTDNAKIEKVRGDAEIGVRGVLYPGKTGRLYGNFAVGVGTARFLQPELVLGYEAVIAKNQEFQLLFGGGLGVGHESYHDSDSDGVLKVNYFPLRADLTALLRDDSRAYQIGLFVTYHIAGSQEYCPAPDSADCLAGNETSTGIAGALYLALGAEATLYFGDFKTKSKGKSKGRSSGGSGRH